MGIDPTVWGPNMWAIIHMVCLQAPEKIDANVRNAYYMFFSMMPYVLPCDKCREHWLGHIQKYPIDEFLENRHDLFKWSVTMHNVVNQSLGKPEVEYEKALDHWTKVSKKQIPTANCIKTGVSKINLTYQHGFYLLLLGVLLSAVAYIVWYKK